MAKKGRPSTYSQEVADAICEREPGRPRVYGTPEEMAEALSAYFTKCDDEKRPYTIAGMAYELGFVDRHAIAEYEKREEFSATIKMARTRIEMQRSERLVSGDGNVTGMIFDLKNNFGWRDKSEQELSGPDGGPMQQVTTVRLVPLLPKGSDE